MQKPEFVAISKILIFSQTQKYFFSATICEILKLRLASKENLYIFPEAAVKKNAHFYTTICKLSKIKMLLERKLSDFQDWCLLLKLQFALEEKLGLFRTC